MLDCDDRLSDLWLQGEVSGCSQTASGHLFFNLKDASGQLACVLFSKAAARQVELPQNGSSYIMHGRVDVYEATGKLQFYVNEVQPAGVGRLHLEFEALKARLESEGLFAIERKRPLPAQPGVIGIVTSPTAAAYQDILNVLGRRYPLARVILSPTQVQGSSAPPQIVQALELLNQQAQADVIIMARGGGSLEDLWAFNDERVARAVFASHIPVVTGVGHEVDFTIVDYVSDLRAPTPSAAAELVTPNIEQLREDLRTANDRLYTLFQDKLDEKRSHLDDTGSRLERVSPLNIVEGTRRNLNDLRERCAWHLRHRFELEHTRIDSLTARLQVLNPQQILERGYALVTHDEDDSVVSELVRVESGQELLIRIKDGTFKVRVI